MDRALRIGIVGFGAVARLHCAAYRSSTSIELTGVTDISPARRQAAAQEFGLTAYDTLEEMLTRATLDVACVLTPPASHEEITAKCAAAGVHVLCEKPLAVSIGACERMIAACRAGGVRLSYGASYRYLPALTVAREHIQRGDLGDIVLLREYVVGGRGPAYRGTLGPGHYPVGGPGGSGLGLCDHGIHLIDTFAWLTNSPTIAAWGRGNMSGGAQGTEFLHLEYANGAIGQLLYEDGTYPTDLPHEGIFGWAGGWSAGRDNVDIRPGAWQAHPGCIHVHGTRGALRIFHYANKMYWRDDAGVREVMVPDRPFPSSFALQLEDFVRAIRRAAATPVPGEVGLEACRIMLAAYAGNTEKTGVLVGYGG